MVVTPMVVGMLLLIPLTSRSRPVPLPWNLPGMKGEETFVGVGTPGTEFSPFSVFRLSGEAEQCWELEVGHENFVSLPSPPLPRGGTRLRIYPILGEKLRSQESLKAGYFKITFCCFILRQGVTL